MRTLLWRCSFVLGLVGCALAAGPASSQGRVAFTGTPQVKVLEAGVARAVEPVPSAKAGEFSCVITELDGRYHWSSRGGKELVRATSGAFITYVAIDGSGFVRTIAPGAKASVSIMGETETKYDYVEQLLMGLRVLTYYGTARQP